MDTVWTISTAPESSWETSFGMDNVEIRHGRQRFATENALFDSSRHDRRGAGERDYGAWASRRSEAPEAKRRRSWPLAVLYYLRGRMTARQLPAWYHRTDGDEPDEPIEPEPVIDRVARASAARAAERRSWEARRVPASADFDELMRRAGFDRHAG